MVNFKINYKYSLLNLFIIYEHRRWAEHQKKKQNGLDLSEKRENWIYINDYHVLALVVSL